MKPHDQKTILHERHCVHPVRPNPPASGLGCASDGEMPATLPSDNSGSNGRYREPATLITASMPTSLGASNSGGVRADLIENGRTNQPQPLDSLGRSGKSVDSSTTSSENIRAQAGRLLPVAVRGSGSLTPKPKVNTQQSEGIMPAIPEPIRFRGGMLSIAPRASPGIPACARTRARRLPHRSSHADASC
jgi:hypothetical protein